MNIREIIKYQKSSNLYNSVATTADRATDRNQHSKSVLTVHYRSMSNDSNLHEVKKTNNI